jgi:hypothetical protein
MGDTDAEGGESKIQREMMGGKRKDGKPGESRSSSSLGHEASTKQAGARGPACGLQMQSWSLEPY